MTAAVAQPGLTTKDLIQAVSDAMDGMDDTGRTHFRCHMLGALAWHMHEAGRDAEFLAAVDHASEYIEERP